MDKKIHKASDIDDQIKSGIDFIAKPVASTLGPKGNNVIFEDPSGQYIMTNDGVTIAKNVSSKNRIEEAIIEIIKTAALRTNSEGGDGTTTTTTLAAVLAKEAMKLIADGYSWIEVRDNLNIIKDAVLKKLEKQKIKVDGKKGLREIASISANNDAEIAENVMKAIEVAKEEGMIFLEGNNKPTTELIEDLGFMVQSGVLYQELMTEAGKNSVVFKDTPVLLTDKKLYYSEEAETILRTAVKAGHKSIVIVARDFMGDALNTLIANHTKGVIKVMLVKAEVDEKNSEKLQDLAIYIDGKVITEKTGSLVNKITADDFVLVNQVFSDPMKTLFTPKTSNTKKLKERIAFLREELEKDKENEEAKRRLAHLTTGVVTIRVGGYTAIDMREKVFRYEDAVCATRSAMKHGYLVGGGTALLRSYDEKECANKDFLPLYRKFTEAIVRQIADNAGKHSDTVITTINLSSVANQGYNAREDKYEDLLKAGVIDPFMVVKLAVEGAVSTAITIVSVKYYMVNDIEDAETE